MTRWAIYRFSPWMLFWSTALFGSIWLCTESGLRWIAMMARPVLPPALQIGDVRGSLLTGFSIADIIWDDGSTFAHIQDAELTLRYRSLLRGQIQVAKLGAGSVSVKLGPPQPPSEEASDPTAAPSIPELPKIVLDQLAVGSIRIRPFEGERIEIQRLRMRARHEAGRLQIVLQEFRYKDLPGVVARLDTDLHPQSLDLRSLAVGLESGGEIRVSGNIHFARGLRANLRAQVRNLDLHPINPDLSTPLEGDVAISAEISAEGKTDIRISDLQLTGAWRNHPLSVEAREIRTDTQVVDIGDLMLRHAQAEIRAHGQVGQVLDVEFAAKIPDLARISPRLSGNVDVSGTAIGPLKTPDLNLRGSIEALEAGALSLARASWNGRVVLIPGQPSNWNMQIQDLQAGGTLLDSVDLRIDGRPRALRARVDARGPDISAQTEVLADVRDSERTPITLNALKLSLAGIEEWALSAPARIMRKGQAINIARSCLLRNAAEGASDTTLCLNGNYAPDVFAFELQLDAYPFAALAELAELNDTQINGSASLSAKLYGRGSEFDARAEIQTTAITITGSRDDDPLQLLELLPGRGQLAYGSRGLDVELRLPGVNEAGLELVLRTDSAYEIQEGRVALGLENLELLTILSDEILRVDGQLALSASLGGNLLQQPEVTLDAILNARELALNSPEIELKSLQISAKGDTRKIVLSGRAGSGNGGIKLSGDYSIAEKMGRLHVGGNDFRVLDSALGRVEISPDITLAVSASGADIGGVINIPFADIHPEALPAAGSDYVAPSVDQVILQDEATEKAGPFAVTGKIRVVLGRKVKFEGFGLTTNIAGNLNLLLEPDKAPVGTGELSLVDGRYKAYGQDLTLERGRIIFSGGPLDTPGVDLRAYRKPTPDVTVGIQVRGSVPKPSVTLWSDPEMAQTEQLSWLVLGRSSRAETESEEDSLALQNATLALGLKGGDFLAKRFKGKLGLDELTIGTQPGEQTNQAALVLGKYLNPRIYVSYGIGLFEPIYTFRLRYFISSKWTLQTISGVESGGDIVYTIER